MAKAKAKDNGRNSRGQFAEGNPGGPGRPPRPIEREYLAVLSDAVPLARWRKIVDQVADFAEKGERWAVEWIAKYLLGEPAAASLSLTELAMRDGLGIEAGHEIAAEGAAVLQPGILEAFARADSPTVLDRALKLVSLEKESPARERVEGEPELQLYREAIYLSPNWGEAEYLEWIATAPVDEIVAWAQSDPLDDAQARGA